MVEIAAGEDPTFTTRNCSKETIVAELQELQKELMNFRNHVTREGYSAHTGPSLQVLEKPIGIVDNETTGEVEIDMKVV